MRMLFLLTTCTAMAAPGVKWGDIPLSFEPNRGQASTDVRYLARGSAFTLYLSSGETLLAARNQSPLRTKLLGANLAAGVLGESRQESTSNYYVGKDQSQWRTSVPNYGRVRYAGVYPGIDLVYYGNEGKLEYDWIISPGADPRKIRLAFDGADQLRIDQQGDLVIKLGKNEYRHRKPVVYQEAGGKRVPVTGSWALHGREGSFHIGPYDRAQRLVIDPVLIYATYNGGNGLDFANALAVDRAGNTFVTGGAGSANFPTANPLQGSLKGAEDVFVTKINANGSARVFSTYLGGGGMDEGKGIAVDNGGNVYVTGSAGSFDFPMLGAIQGTWGGSGDAFVTKLNGAGSLVYSTYLGGNAIDEGRGLAVDPAGNAYVVGITFSTNFPTVNPFQAAKGAQQDAFVAKINPGGTAWVYATYLGGNAVDEGYGIAADATGNAYVTGYTGSTNFPLQSPIRVSNLATVDAFVTKLNAAGSALVYSTYLGGSGTDYGTAIAVDSSGSAYVTGVAGSNDFPVVNAMQPNLAVADDAFVAKFNPSGSALVYSTYLGGGSEDQAYALAIDQAGNAWVTGRTNSSDFPLTTPIQATRFAFDIFVTEINAAGSARLFSTFLGGTGSESGRGIAVDRLGNIHVAGETTSTDFPVVNAIQQTNGGGAVSQDAFVLQLGDLPWPASSNDFSKSGRSGALLYDPSNGQSYTLLSTGNGTYQAVGNLLTPAYDTLRTGDFNRDGKADLVVYNSHTALAYIGMGNGDGTFSFQSLFWSPGYDFVETGDLNGDGKTDFVLYNSSVGTMYTAISTGSGSFTYKYTLLSTGLTCVRLADFTGDGKADIFLYRATDAAAYLGVGDGIGGFTFNSLSLSVGYNLNDIGDLNGDGKQDVILYNSATGNASTGISNGTGGFTFTPLPLSPGFSSVRLADYTGDGKADLTVYNQNNAAGSLGTGTGTGTFNFQSLFWSPGYDFVIPEDVNGDGRADVILYNSATGTEYTGISNGNGTFSYTYSYWGIGRVLAQDAEYRFTPPGTLNLSRASLNFGVNGALVTSPQTISIAFTNGAGVAWTASANQPTISVNPSSGFGSGSFVVTVGPGSSGVITVTAAGASNSPQQVQVNVTNVAPALPFGSFDTPGNNATGISGAIPVTGWALDGIGVTNVGIWREPVPGEPTALNGLVFIGDANIVAGARPDVQATYPNTPFNDRAGWGYQMLTNFLPNSSGAGALGNGTYKLHAIITNTAGVTLDLGTRTVTVDNAHATAPFGTIDTPAQGATISGSAYVNFGWALTPNPYNIPTNGATIFVYVDGVPQGHPVYNLARSDIQTLFPGYANTNGAVGYFYLDTTKLADGIHTISWSVTDSGGRTGGIGSRYFTVANSGGGNVPAGDEPIEAARITADATGIYSISMEELGRIELPVGATNGYLLVKDERLPLPVGSTLQGGRFYWQAGPGFLGNYDLEFERPSGEQVRVQVTIRPRTYSIRESR